MLNFHEQIKLELITKLRDEMHGHIILNGVASSSDAEQFEGYTAKKHLERQSLVLWRRPIQTLKYCALEVFKLFLELCVKLLDARLWGLFLILVILYNVPGPHARYIHLCQRNMSFCLYWMSLGVLSSIGFGTGLHTFLLYLGPHIAGVTLAAYECQSLNFPEPPYPDAKICPQEPYKKQSPTFWSILTKVHVEALIWGIGTAVGELPPYFMAKAARLSAQGLENSEPAEDRQTSTSFCGNPRMLERCKFLIEHLVRRTGFFGILACASIPNPFFDLAGITCGHFLVPFWKFFVATLIGKAFIKNYIQQAFVIVAFNERLIDNILNFLNQLPMLGKHLQETLKSLLKSTKQRMHSYGKNNATKTNLIARAFEFLAIVMLTYFVVSIVNSMAQRRCKRMQRQLRIENKMNQVNQATPPDVADNDVSTC